MISNYSTSSQKLPTGISGIILTEQNGCICYKRNLTPSFCPERQYQPFHHMYQPKYQSKALNLRSDFFHARLLTQNHLINIFINVQQH